MSAPVEHCPDILDNVLALVCELEERLELTATQIHLATKQVQLLTDKIADQRSLRERHILCKSAITDIRMVSYKAVRSMYEQYVVEMCFNWEHLQDRIWDIFECYLDFQVVTDARRSIPNMYAIATHRWGLEDADTEELMQSDSDTDSDMEADEDISPDTSSIDDSDMSDSDLHTSLNANMNRYSLVDADGGDNEEFRSL